MTKAKFVDDININVVARDGETFTLKMYLPVPKDEQQTVASFLAHSFEKNFSKDKLRMVYWVLMDTMANGNFSFYSACSDRSEERKRIGKRIARASEEELVLVIDGLNEIAGG